MCVGGGYGGQEGRGVERAGVEEVGGFCGVLGQISNERCVIDARTEAEKSSR